MTDPPLSRPPRLLSLDVFRGAVILAMLIVNNLGDFGSTGYFWKHPGFIPAVEGYSSVQYGAFAAWWEQIRIGEAPIHTAFTQLPIWRHCTLADFVMPMFMLIIGLSIPYSVASAKAREETPALTWLRVLKRAGMLVLLGWILCYFRDQFASWWRSTDGKMPFRISLGMDVLQLLGVGYLLARVLYAVPPRIRLGVALGLFLWHWGLLRFGPQAEAVPRGTFTAAHNAVGYIYSWDWRLWRGFQPASWLSINWRGLLSVPPAAGMMLLGTLMGDWLRRDDIDPRRRVAHLALGGLICAVTGFLWAFDLPFNKDRWTPCYLMWCAGVGAMLISVIYVIVDIHQVRGWTYVFVVLGSNAIAAYFVTILAKVLLLNTPRVDLTRAGSMRAVEIGTLLFVTLTAAWATWLVARALVRHLGPAGYAVWAPIAGILIILWVRVAGVNPVEPATQPALIQLGDAVINSLKQGLGRWEGGWVFTITFVIFWCLVLDAAYRKRIIWKL